MTNGTSKWSVHTIVVQPRVKEDQENLAEFLGQGWEPFSASYVEITGAILYHLRKPVEEKKPKAPMIPFPGDKYNDKRCSCGDWKHPGTSTCGPNGCYNRPA